MTPVEVPPPGGRTETPLSLQLERIEGALASLTDRVGRLEAEMRDIRSRIDAEPRVPATPLEPRKRGWFH